MRRLLAALFIASLLSMSLAAFNVVAKDDVVLSLPIGQTTGVTPTEQGILNVSAYVQKVGGRIYVADANQYRIMLFNNGKLISEIPIPTGCSCADIYVDSDNIYLLDNIGNGLEQTARIYVISHNGTVKKVIDVPENEDNILWVYSSNEKTAIYRIVERIHYLDGQIILTYTDGSQYTFDAEKGFSRVHAVTLVPQNEYSLLPVFSRSVPKRPSVADYQEQVRYKTAIYGREYEFDAVNEAFGASIIKTGDQVFLTYFDAVAIGEGKQAIVRLEHSKLSTVIHISPSSEFYIQNPWHISGDGNVIFTRVRNGSIEFVQADWSSDMVRRQLMNDKRRRVEDDDAKADEGPLGIMSSMSATPSPSLDRATILSRALAYMSHSWTYNPDTNSNDPQGVLQGSLPDWLTGISTPTQFNVIPYCWGGDHTLSTFSSRIASNWQAGNDDCSGYYKSGTTGVDCSGYVWATYGMSRGSKTIEATFFTLPNADALQSMDACTSPGHIVLFRHLEQGNPNGFYTYESAAGTADKVISGYATFSGGYRPVRLGAVVNTPNGGELYTAGDQVYITWRMPRSTPSVKIEYGDGSAWNVIAGSAPHGGGDVGNYTWTVPETMTQCRIRISSTQSGLESLVTDMSDNLFQIAPITVLSPNGGEDIYTSSVQTIRWRSSGVGYVKIELSRNGGSSWETLTSSTQNNGSYLWYVSGPSTSSALIRISRTNNPAYADVSNATFTISLPAK